MTSARHIGATLALFSIAGCAVQPGGIVGSRPDYGDQNQVISAPAGRYTCLGADRGTPIRAQSYAWSGAIGQMGDQAAADGKTSGAFAEILFSANEPEWVAMTAMHPLYKPSLPTVRCSVAGVRPDGADVFL